MYTGEYIDFSKKSLNPSHYFPFMRRSIKKKIREAKKAPHKLAITYLYNFTYMAGLSFLILFIFSTQRPEALIGFNAAPYTLFFLSIALIAFSVLRLKIYRVTWRRTFRGLATITLFPGVLGLIATLWGETILVKFFTDIPLPLVQSYLQKKTPQLLTLTIGYFLIGLGLYQLSEKFK